MRKNLNVVALTASILVGSFLLGTAISRMYKDKADPIDFQQREPEHYEEPDKSSVTRTNKHILIFGRPAAEDLITDVT